jgi:copper chaperone CopZ
MSSRKTCFVIAPIGEPDSDTRKRSDQVLKHVITPAVKECGYEPVRADQISEPGIITSQVIQHIVDDPLVIADLTERNPNVFYELAVRHAIRKPLIQLIKKGEIMPFDVAGTRTISVDHRDLDSVEEARRDIVKQIKAVEANPAQIDTPISVSLDLQSLRQSENPEQRSLADILSALSELRSVVAAIEKKIDSTGQKQNNQSTPVQSQSSIDETSMLDETVAEALRKIFGRTQVPSSPIKGRPIK